MSDSSDNYGGVGGKFVKLRGGVPADTRGDGGEGYSEEGNCCVVGGKVNFTEVKLMSRKLTKSC